MEDREVQSGRSDELNGLRGIAALIVVLYHFFILFPDSRWTLFWKVSPFSVLTCGHGSVVLFFLLSGYALHRMLLTAVPFRYSAFALRRLTRIYGPYLAALAFAVAGDLWLSRGMRPNFSEWFNQTWTVPFHQTEVWQHVVFLGEYNTKTFNCAFWSLVHETRISLIFPFVLLAVRGRSAAWSSSVALSLLIIGSLLKANIAVPNNLGESLHYAGLFVAGIYLSEHQRSLANWFRQQGAMFQKLFFVGALALFCYGRFTSHLVPDAYAELQNIPVGIASAGIIVMAFGWAPFAAFLVSKPIGLLGTMSYSLYLVHATVLFGLVDLLDMNRPNMLLLPLYLVVTLLTTQLFYLAIERPLVLLSRKFTPNWGSVGSTPLVSHVTPATSKSLHHQ